MKMSGGFSRKQFLINPFRYRGFSQRDVRHYCRSAVVSHYMARGERDKGTGSPLFSSTIVFKKLVNIELNLLFKKIRRKKEKKKEKP